MDSRYIKFSTLSAIKKMHINTTISRVARIVSADNSCQGVEAVNSPALLMSVNVSKNFGKTWHTLQNFTMSLLHDTAIPLVVVCPRECHPSVCQGTSRITTAGVQKGGETQGPRREMERAQMRTHPAKGGGGVSAQALVRMALGTKGE